MTPENLLVGLDQLGWKTKLTDETIRNIAAIVGLRRDSFFLAVVAAELAVEFQPITLRGLFYRAVSAGWFPSTDDRYYKKIGRILSRLRRERVVPYEWIVDNLRSTLKPSSWSGLSSFAETTCDSYRKDFWSNLPDYVHVFIEKDAMSGVVQPVTVELDVPLSPVRGYTSDTFAHDVGSQWRNIDKPIHCYYLGDFDPSGFDLERSLREKLEEHSGRVFAGHNDGDASWTRLGLNAEDFAKHNLITLDPKQSDTRTKKFVKKYGSRCAEIDALDPHEVRRRVRDAIESHIPTDQWNGLKAVEAIERETWVSTIGSLVDG